MRGKLSSVACCGCCDPTLASRWIGFFGLALSTALTCVLIADRQAHRFERSRTLAAALGLDWQHLHAAANATRAADYSGNLISVIMVFHSAVYLLTNMLLIFASITENRWCVLPWLAFEVFGCLSKLFAMVHHKFYEHMQFTKLFYIGSICYIGVWWITVVLLAQKSWNCSLPITQFSPDNKGISLSRIERVDDITFASYNPQRTLSIVVDAPMYVPNAQYCEI